MFVSKIKWNHLFRDGLHLLESGKIYLANNFICYLNSVHSVNFVWNLWNLEFRGTEEGGPNESLTKEISGVENSNANVLKDDLDLNDVKTLRLKDSPNPLISYLNINSLQNKTDALREITNNFPLDIFFIDETKLGDSFTHHQFKIDSYHFPLFRRDRNKFGGGKIVMLKMLL